ncbi:hypothetical protein D3C73_1407020 [compost metagenome]
MQSATPVASSKDKNKNKIVFKLAVSGDANALKQLLDRFEHSIRAIDVTNLVLEQTNGKLTMTIDANAFYEPERVIELTDKVVKP